MRRTSFSASHLVVLALVAPLLTLLGVTGPAAAVPAQPAVASVDRPPATLTQARREVLRFTNNYRRARGLRLLTAHTCLDRRVAHPWAVRMARTGTLSHQNLSKIFTTCPGFTRVAENIAAGQRTSRQVVVAWMHSPGHRANILNPRLRSLGIGYARSTSGVAYWVQDFGGVA